MWNCHFVRSKVAMVLISHVSNSMCQATCKIPRLRGELLDPEQSHRKNAA